MANVYSDDREYLVEDLKKTFVRMTANEHWYQQCWLGVPIWQIADDLMRLQKVIYEVQPDWIIETGTKFGGSAIFFSSLLHMIGKTEGGVVTIDINVLPEAREVFASHKYGGLVKKVIEGDAASVETARQVSEVLTKGSVLVFIDDNHNKEHVRRELELYPPMVTNGSYCILADTVYADLAGTPLAKSTEKYRDMESSNPREALNDWLSGRSDFVQDYDIAQGGICNFPDGFLKRVAPQS